MPVTEITLESEFDEYLSNNKLVFVDFYADWCGPCRGISPFIEELSEKYVDVKFLKVNIDVCEEIANRYNIRALPTFMCFNSGNSMNMIVGADCMKVDYALLMLTENDKPSDDF